MLAEMSQAVLMRRKALLTVRVVLLLNQTGRRCSRVEKLPWQRHCFHYT